MKGSLYQYTEIIFLKFNLVNNIIVIICIL